MSIKNSIVVSKIKDDNCNTSPNLQKKKTCALSIISLIISILGVVFYSLCFENLIFHPFFVATAFVSLIMPTVSKAVRFSKNRSGKSFEIAAIVIGGFNFYCFVFAMTQFPIFIAYLGWAFSIILYSVCKKTKT